MTKPLDDITVIEVDSWMAAPSAGAILADLGANVIKVEPPAGDPLRNMGRPAKTDDPVRVHDFQFDVDNRGKKSIRLDLTREDAIGIVHRLCEKADVFMSNLLAPRQAKYRLDPTSLLSINPELVHATLTGYGTQGPDAWRPGYDVTAFFGRSGLYDSMRESEDGAVTHARTAQGDHTTGLALVGAILAALRMVDRGHQGQVVETSLYETAVWTLASDYSVAAVDLAPVRKRARHEQLSVTANEYPCGDGKWIVVNMPEAFWWPRFCNALGRPDWADDDRYREPRDRYRRMPELVPMIDEVFLGKTRDEWGEIFDRHGIIWGPVLAIHEVAKDPQAEAINLFPKMSLPGLGDYRTVRTPMNFRTTDISPTRPAPRAGEDTGAIMRAAGYSSEEITAFMDAEVIS